MKGFILAAGLGTRLRPFTLENPKALVKVGGITMLERVIKRMIDEGIGEIFVNVHHFGEKIRDFLRKNGNFGAEIHISDETSQLLDTGGGLLKVLASPAADEPLLIHNVDILTYAPFRAIGEKHILSGAAATLVVTPRESSRRLIFDAGMSLRGWHNVAEGRYRPEDMDPARVEEEELREYAFSGLHVVSPGPLLREMERQGRRGVFSVIDFYLESIGHLDIRGELMPDISILDIGKPAALAQANLEYGRADGR